MSSIICCFFIDFYGITIIMNKTPIYNPSNANDNTTNQRRRFPRREQDICMVNVDGHPYPVLDWSQCGVLFEGDTRVYTKGQKVSLILRFKLNNAIEDIKIIGEVVRTNAKTVATQFTEIPETIQKSFEKVINSSVA